MRTIRDFAGLFGVAVAVAGCAPRPGGPGATTTTR